MKIKKTIVEIYTSKYCEISIKENNYVNVTINYTTKNIPYKSLIDWCRYDNYDMDDTVFMKKFSSYDEAIKQVQIINDDIEDCKI